jgi:thiol:disulfide interchange protein DsbD
MIRVMVDDKHQLAQPITVTENGRTYNLTTVGEKWSYLQRHKFNTNTQPYYMILNHKGEPLSPAAGYDENVDKFMDWLNGGIANYKK